MATYRLEAGRHIDRDGKPFIAIQRCGDTTPCEADDAAREIAATVYRCDYNGPIADKYEGAKNNAAGWYETIQELIARLNSEDASDQEAAREEIQEGPLSVLIRDGWRQPGQAADEGAEEFEILLSTGGPALRLYGKLGRYGEPEDAELQVQDWFLPWTKWAPKPYDETYRDTLLAYASCFYFGE
jgi:hypothetical protein